MKGMNRAAIAIITTFATTAGGAWSQEVHQNVLAAGGGAAGAAGAGAGAAGGAVGAGVGGIVVIGGGLGGDTTPPAIVTLTVSVLTSTTFTLQYADPGDDNMTGTCTSSAFQYVRGNTFDYTQWGDTAITTSIPGVPAPGVSGTQHTVTVTLPIPGDTITVRGRFGDEKPNYSFTPPVTVCLDLIAPPAVNGLAIAALESNLIGLSWEQVADDSDGSGTASSYTVYYSPKYYAPADGAAMLVDADTIALAVGNSMAATIPGLNDAATYCFMVRPFDEAPNAGPPSQVLAATTPAYVDAGDSGIAGGGCSANGAQTLFAAGLAILAIAMKR